MTELCIDLPVGAMAILDKIVKEAVIGETRSEVLRHLVMAGLQQHINRIDARKFGLTQP